MCGILGTIEFEKVPGAAERVRAALPLLHHRGPDAAELLQAGPCTFGQTLLSIIGERLIVQPVTSEDGRWTMTYNGEIYNYLELLEEHTVLKTRVHVRSDTKVLIEAIAEYGMKAVPLLNGIFAFAAYDHKENVLYLVRDRMGVKPLFYASKGKQMSFASEAFVLNTLLGEKPGFSCEGLYAYARFRYPIEGRSYFKGVKTVRPAHILTVKSNGETSEARYWDGFDAPKGFDGSFDDAVDEFGARFRRTIELQMRSDHSFCTFLSGGLDSSLVTAVAADTVDKVDTYTIGVDDPTKDETKFAEKVSELLKTVHTTYRMSVQEYQEQHYEWVVSKGEPVGVPNQVALKILSLEMSKRHRCVLSGEGADELFAGYGGIFQLPTDWERYATSKNSSGAFMTNFQAQYGAGNFANYGALFLHRYAYLSHQEAAKILEPYFGKDEIDAARASVENDVLKYFTATTTDGIYRDQFRFFQRAHLPGLLHRVDTATMAHHIEGRVPFLDHTLVEFANSLPLSYKQQRPEGFDKAVAEGMTANMLTEKFDVPKVIVKKFAETLLPKDIVYRIKMGFPIPNRYTDFGAAPSQSGQYPLWVERNISLLMGKV